MCKYFLNCEKLLLLRSLWMILKQWWLSIFSFSIENYLVIVVMFEPVIINCILKCVGSYIPTYLPCIYL